MVEKMVTVAHNRFFLPHPVIVWMLDDKDLKFLQIRWGEKILLLGGSSKDSSDELMVRYIDIETCQVGVIKTSGSVPVARTGQSATLVGSRVILFGGEDMSRKLLNDVHALDLESMTWDLIETTQTPPTPRYDHAAAIQGERYLLIFGGCSHSIFFNDLHLLDLQTMEWSQPQIQGDLVSPRAGHAGINVDGSWFIVGGGDNKSGCPETLVWNMSKLVWSVLTVVKQKDPLSSEGLSVCSALIGGENHLLAFGGYNGRYSNEVCDVTFIYKFSIVFGRYAFLIYFCQLKVFKLSSYFN
ncbi:PREDICTED: acyl-CoA-binding domain-containing protein 5-like isoform X2 [Lupinus angustifolius]|uniref:acyl-CoA-binding domain-containing protein 5-like isoform X2 n=1 Tax=Lupinus angustifolius TaxID=3871 RepID=UPI00092E4548|nr:PREDICTED: acyl-CoA-binding domain-containing protein 5-like isoform X2 [Lupinus angustifolius]